MKSEINIKMTIPVEFSDEDELRRYISVVSLRNALYELPSEAELLNINVFKNECVILYSSEIDEKFALKEVVDENARIERAKEEIGIARSCENCKFFEISSDVSPCELCEDHGAWEAKE